MLGIVDLIFIALMVLGIFVFECSKGKIRFVGLLIESVSFLFLLVLSILNLIDLVASEDVVNLASIIPSNITITETIMVFVLGLGLIVALNAPSLKIGLTGIAIIAIPTIYLGLMFYLNL